MAPRPEVRRERRELKERLESGDPGPYFVAERDGERVIGLQHWEPAARGRPYMPESCAELAHAIIAEGERGQGGGSALFAEGLAWARDAGYTNCVIDWEVTNLDANRFWPGHGFRPFCYTLGRRLESR